MTYQEAPTLAEKVAAGELPPVAERLPAEPRVVEPLEIGQYGGTWHMGTRGGGDEVIYLRTVGYHMLVRWNTDWTGVVPDVAKSFEVNDEGTVFTFHLREGMKWSDGEPFTADDILFAFNDVFMNTDLNPATPNWYKAGGEPGQIEKLDDYTVQFTFKAPNGLFLQNLAVPHQQYVVQQPKHYLSQFHKTYADAAKLDEMVAEAGVETWVDLISQKGAWAGGHLTLWNNAELPTVNPWVVTNALSPEATQVRLVRNPYFYGVDTEGNQLPYIDEVVYNVGQDVETLVLQAMSGEIDMQDRHIGTNANLPVFFDNQEKGGYHFYSTVPSSSNVMVISLNQTNLDLDKRAIYQNKDFRIGLSYAIDRQQIIDVVYVGQGQPYQAAPRPQSPLYNEQLATQYTEYNVDLANEYLDKVVPDKDADGYRLMPNGQRLVIALEVIPTLFPEWTSAIELIQGYWKSVGIDMQPVVEDRTLFYDRKMANLHDANIWGGDGGLEVILEPRWYFPFSNESSYGEAWQYWFNNPADERAEEPSEATKQQMDLYNQLRATADPEGQNEIMKQILQIAADQFYTIGISLPSNGYGVIKNNMHNVPDTILQAYLYPSPAPTN
ncbi:MAG TPA: ABC transporter substrate-binding protein, partial [Phototrophicaceae bacterium]|nr:ABC transporter substrate-binding protein [Phototrophicaceae bacterium]